MAQSVLPFLMVADASFFPQRPNFARSSPQILHTLASLFCALLHGSETHLLFFQSSPHSLRVYPGWHQERFPFPPPTHQSPLSPAESALTDELRVLTEVGRTSLSATPLESVLTARRFVTPLESALTKKRGEGHRVK